MKAFHMPFTNIFTYIYHQHAKTFVTTFIKTPHISENMTIWSRDSTKDTKWGNTEKPRTSSCKILSNTLNMNRFTRLLQLPTKQLKTLHASLFYLLPLVILEDIGICLSGLEHGNKFKHVISHFKSMCNPVLHGIPHDLWNPYHNFRVFRWYNKFKYDWAYRCILAR